MAIEFVSSDTGSTLRITCKDNRTGTAIDLTGSTVSLRWLGAGGVLVSRTMTIVTALSGIAEYKFVANELIPGIVNFEVQILDGAGFVLRNLTLLREEVRTVLS